MAMTGLLIGVAAFALLSAFAFGVALGKASSTADTDRDGRERS